MRTFEIKDNFYLDGKTFQVISGSIHYFRVVPQYWRDRLLKLLAMGCNTVETYIPWNFHEPRKGEFNFDGMRDVEGFVRLAQELGLYVILRPSPYICAEWEFGGLPAWLLKEDGIRLRCYDQRYLKHVMDYYDELIPRLVPLQITHGGPVIMMQVENEYGSYGDDKEYLAALRDGMLQRGVDVPLVTSDGPEHDMLLCGKIDGVFQTGNFGSQSIERFRILSSYGISPQMCMEFWCGWFDHWGNDGHKTTDPETCAKDFADILDRGHVNIYMFHGGTSFGLMNGANDYGTLTPDVTSYDYDAPLSEEGMVTEKYRLFQKAIQERRNEPLPTPELETISRKAYGKAQWEASATLLDAAKQNAATHTVTPVSMERLGQDYGYVLYSTKLIHEQEIRKIQLVKAADRAKIYLDGELILTLYDRELDNAHTFEVPVPVRPGAQLDILVENLGRVNYSYRLEMQRKGIDQAVVINDHQHYGWDIVCLGEAQMKGLQTAEHPAPQGKPTVQQFAFMVDEPADTYLALPGWGKGVVFLNDFCLGRFWEIGPQKRLYIPAPLLKDGENVLRIIETEGRTGDVLLLDEPDLG
ncbi:MAG: beta-galactosidase [Clostridiales bacterium]|nr:beta-galactosidase [Clostridiales bacterium]